MLKYMYQFKNNILKAIFFLIVGNEKYSIFMKKTEYQKLGMKFLIVNSIFQDIFGINASFPRIIHFTSKLTSTKNIKYDKFNNNVLMSFANSGNCYYQGINGIEIGNDTIWAPGVKFISANHDPNSFDKHVKSSSIKIGKNVWIGTNVIILPEVKIGDNSIIGAGTVLSKSVPKNSIAYGNPLIIKPK